MVVSDIPGAFLHADMEDNVHMLLEGTVAEMIIKLDPKTYKEFFVVQQTWQSNAICAT